MLDKTNSEKIVNASLGTDSFSSKYENGRQRNQHFGEALSKIIHWWSTEIVLYLEVVESKHF